jgi:hypothetical protein
MIEGIASPAKLVRCEKAPLAKSWSMICRKKLDGSAMTPVLALEGLLSWDIATL